LLCFNFEIFANKKLTVNASHTTGLDAWSLHHLVNKAQGNNKSFKTSCIFLTLQTA